MYKLCTEVVEKQETWIPELKKKTLSFLKEDKTWVKSLFDFLLGYSSHSHLNLKSCEHPQNTFWVEM